MNRFSKKILTSIINFSKVKLVKISQSTYYIVISYAIGKNVFLFLSYENKKLCTFIAVNLMCFQF